MRLKQAIYYLLEKINSDFKKIMVTDTASGAIASFPDGSDLLPALSFVANIVPKQSGSGTPSPDNVREISGWESVVLTDAGKNLVNWTITESTFATSYNGFGQGKWQDRMEIPASWAGKTLTYSAYFVTGSEANQAVKIWLFKDGTYLPPFKAGSYIIANSSGVSSLTITIPSSEEANQIAFGLGVGGGTKVSNPQVELGTTATAYEPYTATTHNTDLGRTVYGGTVDVVSGVLTVTHAMVDLGTLNYSRQASSGVVDRYLTTDIASVVLKQGTIVLDLLSSAFVADNDVAYDRQKDNIMAVLSATGGLYIAASGYSSASDFKTAVTGQTLVYPLATPQTYQLTPQTINTLAGVNNVWADSGDCSITYYADTKLYIDKKLGGN